MHVAKTGLLLAWALSLAACQQAAESQASILEAESQPQETMTSNAPIPGPRTCFWSRGPYGADPYINIAYPDANVFYWAAAFTIPDGAKLYLKGDYPHSRYMSLISYDERGRPVESLADYLIEPNKTEGSVNPYLPRNVRNSSQRNYSVEIVNKTPESDRAIGERSTSYSGNVLHTPSYGRTNQQAILYRIYLPDDGKAPNGGVNLPDPELSLPDGRVLSGSDACKMLKTRQPLQISLNAVGVPPSEYRTLINKPGKPDTWPSKIPAEWFIQLDRESLLGIYTGYINPEARRSEGGFYPNLDNHYVRTIINRKHGPVFLLRGKAPTTPKTYGGDKVMGDGELRYWSVCSNQGFANTRVNDCLFDEEIPLDPRGYYTIVVSREEDRPRNAIPECGIGWLPMAEDGDGLFDPDVTIVQIRHMLTAPGFEQSVQRVFRQEDLNDVMGEYLPSSRYSLPNQIEAFFPCITTNTKKNGG